MLSVIATCAAILAMGALVDRLNDAEATAANLREALRALRDGRGEFVEMGNGRFTVRWRPE